jgi:hypothetical protein
MGLFELNPFRKTEELTPSELRQPRMTAWLRVLMRPTKYITDLFLTDYCKGANYPYYDNSTTYIKNDRVIWSNYCVYELKVATSTGVDPTGEALSTTNWRKVLNDFLGVDEKVRYNGQLIVFEYALNRRFRVSAPPYIYCVQVTPPTGQLFVEIMVPAAVYAALGTNNTARDNRIKEFAFKYTLAGRDITVTPY